MTIRPVLALCLAVGLTAAAQAALDEEPEDSAGTDTQPATEQASAPPKMWADPAVQTATQLAVGKIRACAGEPVCESREVAHWQDFLRHYAQQGADTHDLHVHVSGERVFLVDTMNAYSTRAGVSEMPLSDEPGRGRGPSLDGEVLVGADLKGRNLANARLVGRDLSGADLTGTDLRFAFLTGAKLNGAKLTGANLIGANLEGADLTNADLEGARLFDGDEPSALPVAFVLKWNAILFDTSSLPNGSYIKQINIDKVSGQSFVTFLLVQGNGANVEGANFSGVRNMQSEGNRYICRWGGKRAWQSLADACDNIETATYNPFAACLEPYPGTWLAR